MTQIESEPIVRTCVRIRELRVKIKSLAEESRIIRKEERRCLGSLTRTVGHDEQRAALASSYASLRSHRVHEVRRETRYSLLAYALLRGRSVESTEPKCDKGRVDREKLASLVKRFGMMTETEAAKAVGDWLTYPS